MASFRIYMLKSLIGEPSSGSEIDQGEKVKLWHIHDTFDWIFLVDSDFSIVLFIV